MADSRKTVAAQMSALIRGTFGCLDAASEAINDALGRRDGVVSKGTLSRRAHGHAGWPVDEVIALEDIAGRYPVTRMLARRLQRGDTVSGGSLYEFSGLASKEAGEAVAAALSAAESACSDSLSQAIAEADEAERALRRLRERLESVHRAAGGRA